MLKKKVLLVGPALTNSGYGVHCRQLFNFLSKLDVDLYVMNTNWGNTPWNIDSSDETIKKIIQCSRPLPQGQKADVAFHLQLPNEWNVELGKVNVGVSAMIETDRACAYWVDHCKNMDLIVAPSKHAVRSITNAGICATPMVVVPESYICEIESAEENQDCTSNLSTKFNFLVFGQTTGGVETDRKNTFNTIRWFCEEFEGEKDVGMILKTNMGQNSTKDFEKTVKTYERAIAQIRKAEFPKVHILHGAMSNQDVARLYKDSGIKALVSATRGEGFGLPLLEAAASDLPVIATDWSAHKEYLDMGKWLKLEYKISSIPQSKVDNKIFASQSNWAEVNESSFKSVLRKFYKQSTMPKQWAKDLGVKIREKYNQEQIEKDWMEALKVADIKL